MNRSIEKSIEMTKASFEKSFAEGKLYDRQTQDKEHLKMIMESLIIKENDHILDLGTGSGYLAFEMARRYPKSKVIGLDIVEITLNKNISKALRSSIKNIDFLAYDGRQFPFKDKQFDIITTRYALHHFPQIEYSFLEVARVLKKNGYFFIADPTPNDNDKERFVDDYMAMKKDGHIKYYSKDEFEILAKSVGFKLIKSFKTTISFMRLKDEAKEFELIIKKHNKDVINEYDVKISEDNKYIYITQAVWNLLFVKL